LRNVRQDRLDVAQADAFDLRARRADRFEALAAGYLAGCGEELDEKERIRAEDVGVDVPPPLYEIVVGISTSVVPDVGQTPQQPGGQQPGAPPGGG